MPYLSQDKEAIAMTTKAEQRERDEMAADQHRMDRQQMEADRQTHLVDPLTHPSSGDPPPAISSSGDRLGAVPMTRNAVADQEQAKAEGLEAAEQHEPSKAEKQQAKKPKREAEAKTPHPSMDEPRPPRDPAPAWSPFADPSDRESSTPKT